ncbi:MAG: adenylyltransferase/cytidyltransferase family protein, partial [Hyphomicrobiales bacterium]
MAKTVLYPGSFDPVTNGHLDVLRQALNIADSVVVAIGVHSGKEPLFSFEERKMMISESVAGSDFSDQDHRIDVVAFSNLTVEA